MYVMVLSFFTTQKQKENLSLLVDIGSSSVGIALLVTQKGKLPNIIFSEREDISFQEVLSSDKFLHAMNHALDRVLHRFVMKIKKGGLLQNIKVPISHVFCTLSSPWFILKTRELHVAEEREFEVTERMVDGFIEQNIAELKEELKATLPVEDIRIIEKKIIRMKLNGYDIENPYGKKVSRMEFSVVVGVSSGKVIESIKRKLAGVLHVNSVHFGAFPLAAFSTIRDIFPTENDFLFLDITGESTDVSHIHNDLLLGTVSFPRGKNHFVREISATMQTVHHDAESLLGMFMRDEIDAKKRTQVAAVVSLAEVEWTKRFKKALTTLLGSTPVPHKIFFTTDADVKVIFARLLSEVDKEHPREKIDVQYLDQLIIEKFVTHAPEIIRDPFIAIEALFTEKLIQQHL